MKRFIFILLISLIFVQCSSTNSGTEVLNVLNPGESPPDDRLSIYSFTITVILPDGWSYEEYYAGDEIDPNVFVDEQDEETDLAAHFTKTDGARFTVFGSELNDDETLTEFISSRHDSIENLQTQTNTVNEVTLTLSMIFHEERSVEGNRFVDIYFEIRGQIVWLRAELVGTDAEQQATYNEIWDIILNYEVE